MGAKTLMLAYAVGRASVALKAGPQLNRSAAAQLAKRLFPSGRLELLEDGALIDTYPAENEVYVGSFPGVEIVSAAELGLDHPSQLPPRFLEAANGRTVYLHAMHSVVDWFAYAVWEKGRLTRSLSVSPDSGVLEDLGERRAFEEPYWAGEHPVDDEYPFPFHPLELGEAALLDLFGYQLEGMIGSDEIDPEEVHLLRFKHVERPRPWWRFW